MSKARNNGFNMVTEDQKEFRKIVREEFDESLRSLRRSRGYRLPERHSPLYWRAIGMPRQRAHGILRPPPRSGPPPTGFPPAWPRQPRGAHPPQSSGPASNHPWPFG